MKAVKGRAERTDTIKSRELILKTLGKKELTANQVIDKIFNDDVKKDRMNDRSWKFYVHLNKLFRVLEKNELISASGSIIGPTKRVEKTWMRI